MSPGVTKLIRSGFLCQYAMSGGQTCGCEQCRGELIAEGRDLEDDIRYQLKRFDDKYQVQARRNGRTWVVQEGDEIVFEVFTEHLDDLNEKQQDFHERYMKEQGIFFILYGHDDEETPVRSMLGPDIMGYSNNLGFEPEFSRPRFDKSVTHAVRFELSWSDD